jgi:hypothetical protein
MTTINPYISTPEEILNEEYLDSLGISRYRLSARTELRRLKKANCFSLSQKSNYKSRQLRKHPIIGTYT